MHRRAGRHHRGDRRGRGLARAAALLAGLLLGGCSSEADSPPQAPPDPERPLDLVVVTLDTLRADRLGCYGYERPTSPNLDRFARDCFVFENAQSAAPWTAPSLVSLMTALYPDVHGVLGSPNPGRLDDDVATLAEVLREAGYRTAAFTEGGYARGDFGLEQGFELYPPLLAGVGEEDLEAGSPGLLRANLERTLAWLRDLEDDDPAFLFFHTYKIHRPYVVPEEYVRLMRPDYDEERAHERAQAAIERWNADGGIDEDGAWALIQHDYCRRGPVSESKDPRGPGGVLMRHYECPRGPLPPIRRAEALVARLDELGIKGKQVGAATPEALDWLQDLYDAEIAYTDALLEELWTELERSGRLEHAIVVVVSDHGEGLGDHGLLGHGHVLFEELLRVPLLIRLPESLARPRRVDELVRTVDVMPTVLDWMGLADRLPEVQGRSLRPLMEEGRGRERISFSHALATETDEIGYRSVRKGRWRLIHNERTGNSRLFDLVRNPAESVDLSRRRPEHVGRLEDLLRQQKALNRELREEIGVTDQEAAELDPAVREELETLGYLGDDGG